MKTIYSIYDYDLYLLSLSQLDLGSSGPYDPEVGQSSAQLMFSCQRDRFLEKQSVKSMNHLSLHVVV